MLPSQDIKQVKILLVDSNRKNRADLRALLAGRQIEEAGSIAEALEAVTRSAIGCIVISFTPCCSDTVDLLSRLPRAHPGRSVDMPVVVIVPSDVTEEQMRDIIKNGAEEIIRESDLSARTLSFAMDKAALVSSASQQQSALDRGYLHTSENTSQLRSSELQLIYERASIGMCVLDRQLRYVRINGCLAEMNGVAIDQHIGQTIREVVPDLADTLEPLIENVFLSGKPSLNVEVSGRTKGAPSQTRTWVESWSPLYDKYNQVVAVSGLIEEITRHRRSEREAAFLASIVTSSQDAIISKDLNGIITSWNRAAETLLGYKAEEMIGRHIAVLIPSAHLKEENEIIRKIRSGEIIDHFETVRRRKDGTLIDVFLTISPLRDPLGNIVGASKILRDITERKAIERALRENEERFRVLAENISQLTWMAEPDGTPFWYNRRWYDYTSLSPEESCGDGWKSAFHPEHIDRVVEGMQLARDGGASWEDTIPLRGKDGSYRWFLSRSMPVRDRDGRIVRWLGTNTDVTEKKMADDEREKLLQREKSARSDAERANHIKDEFLATLSHELRTPLNAILGWIHLIRKGNFAQDQVLRGIEVIERNSRVQAQLIADLLDMSRITSGKMRLDIKKTDPAAAMEATVESIRSAAEGKAIHLSLSFDQSRPLIHADPSRLQQIFWNLLSNAVKFTPRGGSISVTLEPLEFHIRICVKDTGKGIKKEFLPHVFERFRQADASSSREHSGLGLGLSIVRQLVELHGGAVRVESEGEGRGATFIVEFPLFTERVEPEAKPTLSRAATSTEAEPPPPLIDLRGISVLLVEDDDDAREMLRLILEYFGAQVFTASSATEGLQTCLSLHPTCIISDVGMPIHDGYKMMGWIRERGINTPAIALTAFARAEDKERAIDNGFNRHLAKPVDPDELARCVKQLVAEEVFASRRAISA